MISLIPFIIASGFWILTLTDNLMLLQIMNANITRYGYVPTSLKRMILSLTIYGIFIMTFLYGLYIIYKNQKCFMASIQYNVCWICLYNNVWFYSINSVNGENVHILLLWKYVSYSYIH